MTTAEKLAAANSFVGKEFRFVRPRRKDPDIYTHAKVGGISEYHDGTFMIWLNNGSVADYDTFVKNWIPVEPKKEPVNG